MLSFESDYIHGTHPEILKKLVETNFEPLSGYGYDKYTEEAKCKIKELCKKDFVVYYQEKINACICLNICYTELTQIGDVCL